jgi:hypothetical protein
MQVAVRQSRKLVRISYLRLVGSACGESSPASTAASEVRHGVHIFTAHVAGSGAGLTVRVVGACDRKPSSS